MCHAIGNARIPLVNEHGLAGKRLEGGGPHKAGAGLGHDHLHTGACALQLTSEHRRLVGCYAAGDSQHDPLAADTHDILRAYR